MFNFKTFSNYIEKRIDKANERTNDFKIRNFNGE